MWKSEVLTKFWTSLGQCVGINRKEEWFQQDGATSHASNNSPAWFRERFQERLISKKCEVKWAPHSQRRSSRPQTPQLGGPRPTLGAQVSLKLLFGYVTIFSSADLFTTDLNCRKKLACDIISEC